MFFQRGEIILEREKKRGTVFSVLGFSIFSVLLLSLCIFTIFGISPNKVEADTSNLVFSDNFDSLNTGNLNGQNNWVGTNDIGSSDWVVISDGAGGNYLKANNDSLKFYQNVVTQTIKKYLNARVKVDFKANTDGQGPQLHLRRTDTTSSAEEYVLFRFKTPNEWHIIGADGSSITFYNNKSSSAAAPANLVNGNWYTAEFEAVNNENGEPVLRGWIYPKGDARPSNPTVYYTDTSKFLIDPGYVGIGANKSTQSYDDVAIYNDNTVAAPATSYTFTGPTTATENTTSTDFTITPNGQYTGTITPSDNDAGGSFSPSSLTFASSSAPQTFTYTPTSLGAKTISVSSTPTLSNPSSINLTVTSPTAGIINVDNAKLVWSPYNWDFNGGTWVQTNTSGAYVKVAFSGSSLGIGIDTSAMNRIDISKIEVDAYIDGTTTPINKKLSSKDSNGLITFSSTLSSGNHYAIIYLANINSMNARWEEPALRITKIQLANDGTGDIFSLNGTPLEKKNTKIMIYGDSITEGYNMSPDEDSYAGILARDLDTEYAQIGYSGIGWTKTGMGSVPYFYNQSDLKASSWRHHDANSSMLVDPNDLSKGFTDGAPDAVYVNLGINDANNDSGATTLQSSTQMWLSDMRETTDPNTKIYVISPFNFGNTASSTYVNYKNALYGGVSDYETNNPSDTKIFTLNLGVFGYNTVQAHSVDGLHPDKTGSKILGDGLADLVRFVTPDSYSLSVSKTNSSATINWTTSTPSSSQIKYGLNDSYALSTNLSDTGTGVTSHSITLSNLLSCTTYHYNAISKDANDNTFQTNDQTFTTNCQSNTKPLASSLKEITSSSGGSSSVTVDGKTFTVTIPENVTATSSSFMLQLKALPGKDIIDDLGYPSGTSTDGVSANVFDVKALINGTTTLDSFDHPITITYHYTDSEVKDLDESTLKLYHYHNGAWVALDSCSVDTDANTITCTTPSFSIFGLFGTPHAVQSSTSVSGRSGLGGRIHYGCKDPKATNYEYFAASNPSLCIYEASLLQTPDSSFTRDLTLGSVGIDVLTLQQFLNTHGFIVSTSGAGSPGNETTTFGSLTKQALAQYQASHNISPAVGYFGPITRASFRNQTTTSLQIPPASTVVESETVFTKDLDLGMTDPEVKLLQKYLNTHGFIVSTSGAGSPGNETNYFGSLTQAAVSKFQIAHNITPSAGYFGPLTRNVVGE